QHLLVRELLGREEKELELSRGELVERLPASARGDEGAHGGRSSRVLVLELLDLLTLKRDQGRDDDGRPGNQQRGYLVDRRLPVPGGHDGERVAPLEHALDRLCLPRPQLLEPEDLRGCSPYAV